MRFRVRTSYMQGRPQPDIYHLEYKVGLFGEWSSVIDGLMVNSTRHGANNEMNLIVDKKRNVFLKRIEPIDFDYKPIAGSSVGKISAGFSGIVQRASGGFTEYI